MAEEIKQIKNNTIGSLDPGNWVIVISETGANPNFASHLQNFKYLSDALLEVYYRIAPIVKLRDWDEILNIRQKAQEKLSEIKDQSVQSVD